MKKSFDGNYHEDPGEMEEKGFGWCLIILLSIPTFFLLLILKAIYR